MLCTVCVNKNYELQKKLKQWDFHVQSPSPFLFITCYKYVCIPPYKYYMHGGQVVDMGQFVTFCYGNYDFLNVVVKTKV